MLWMTSIAGKCPRFARDRLVEIVGFDENRVETSDRTVRGLACSLENFRDQREHAGREPARRGRFFRRQSDLALRLGHAGEGIHHEQNAAALVAEVFGDRAGDFGGANTEQRRVVRR